MVYNFLNGGAAINVLAKHIGAEVLVVDVGVASDFQEHQSLMLEKIDYGTKNMVKGPAMTDEQAVKSLEVGIEAAEEMIKKGLRYYSNRGYGNWKYYCQQCHSSGNLQNRCRICDRLRDRY
jgi:NaMN:DMB phosphoribosyltransferase